jgi:hypothetical protein
MKAPILCDIPMSLYTISINSEIEKIKKSAINSATNIVGEKMEDDQKGDAYQLLRVRLHKNTFSKLKSMASEASVEGEEYISMSDLVRVAIRNYMQVADTRKRLNVILNPNQTKVRKG